MNITTKQTLWLCGVFLLVTYSVCAQQARSQTLTEESAPLAYSVRVELSQIAARVTDKTGSPVSGLRKMDLELLEDGMPQDILFIDEIGGVTKQEAEPQPQTTATKEAHSGPPANSIFIIFDSCNTGQTGIEKHKKYVKEFLAHFNAAGAMLCITQIKPTGDYEMLHNFTFDKDDLSAVVDQIHGSTAGIQEKMLRASQLADSTRLENCASLGGFSRTECAEQALRDVANQAESFASEEQARSSNSIHSFQQLFSMAEHVPGQKSVILISEGMDPAGSFYYNYGADVIEHFIQHFGLPPAMRSILSEARADANRSVSQIQKIQDLIRSANISKLPVYWVNPEYGKTVEDVSSELSGISGFTTKLVNAPDPEFAMRGVAEDTGGMALSSTDMSHFYSRLAAIIPHYYLISYKPKRTVNDGRIHRVEIHSRNPDFRIAYGKDFKDLELKDRIADQLAAAHDFPDMTSSFPIIEEVHSFKKADDKYHVMIHAAVAYHDLEPQISGDVAQDSLHLSFIVRNSAGSIVFDAHPILQIRMPYDKYTELAHGQKVLDWLQSVNLEAGSYQLSLAVMDTAKWKTSAVSATVKLAGALESCLSVSPAMLAGHVSKSDTIAKEPFATENGEILYRDKRMNFAVDRVFPQNGSLSGFYQIYNATATGQTPLSVHVSFKLFRDKNVFINQTPEHEITSFTDPMQNLISDFFSVPYKNLSPGNYELEIDVRDGNNGCAASTRVSFRIASGNEGY